MFNIAREGQEDFKKDSNCVCPLISFLVDYIGGPGCGGGGPGGDN